jgi:hypothetical protein
LASLLLPSLQQYFSQPPGWKVEFDKEHKLWYYNS